MIRLPEDKIDKSGDCWLWLGGVNGDGYGYYKKQRVNRIALEAKLGKPLKGLALHSCGNRLCCNPEHLREGTHKENMSDMTKDGTHDGRNRRGEKHPLSKLTDKDRVFIRESNLRGCELVSKFNVSPATISMLRTGKRGAFDKAD
jgi:hypothetical protein